MKFFAVGVKAFAILDNHCHVVLHVDPARVAGWSDEEVARRGFLLSLSDSEDGRVYVCVHRIGAFLGCMS